MKDYADPLVDDQNPLYCPSISAVSFLETIRQQLHGPGTINASRTLNQSFSSDDDLLPSFTKLLDKSVTANDLLELFYNPTRGDINDSDTSSGSSDPNYRNDMDGSLVLAGLDDTSVKQEGSSPGLPETFSDIKGPVKREMSLPSVNEESFELSAKADRLSYFARGSSYSPYHAKPRRFPFRPAGHHGWRTKVRELQDRIAVLEGM